jgi:hypothetical protein
VNLVSVCGKFSGLNSVHGAYFLWLLNICFCCL